MPSGDLSVIQLVMDAGPVVQAVMGLLALCSVISWWMICQRALYFRSTKNSLVAFEKQFWSGMELSQLYRKSNAKVDAGKGVDGVENIFRAGLSEFSRLRQQVDADAVMEGTRRSMRVAMAREVEKLEIHLTFLATVGSTSPYVGLFGTVWGIMNSFRGLANVQQATLATVAPGISEALVATAMGLFAAIPAVVAYNRYSAKVDYLTNQYETFADEFTAILHRQAHAGSKRGTPE